MFHQKHFVGKLELGGNAAEVLHFGHKIKPISVIHFCITETLASIARICSLAIIETKHASYYCHIFSPVSLCNSIIQYEYLKTCLYPGSPSVAHHLFTDTGEVYIFQLSVTWSLIRVIRCLLSDSPSIIIMLTNERPRVTANGHIFNKSQYQMRLSCIVMRHYEAINK